MKSDLRLRTDFILIKMGYQPDMDCVRIRETFYNMCHGNIILYSLTNATIYL